MVPFKKGNFPFIANGKSQTINNVHGFVKTLFDDRYGQDLGEQEEDNDLVWCIEKTPPEEYEYHEDMVEEDYPDDTADCTTDEYDDDGYDPKYDAFYEDNEF